MLASNRLLKAAMTERMSSWDPVDPSKRGIPGQEIITLYRNWARGGWGVVVSGNVLIHPEHIEAPGNLIIGVNDPLSGPRFEAFKELAEAGKAGGSIFLAQVS
jgi:2,4-dienoyl-CoA reductase-like NADH-dependent reductase (Old Yellow Enzyme family)